MLRFSISLLVLVILSSVEVKAQINTRNTDEDADFDQKKERPEKTRLRTIIRSDTRRILYGNKCFEDFTAECGYEYVIMPKGQLESMSATRRFFHNFGAKFALLFRNGPFWKIKEKKKKKECINLTRDLVGA